MHPPPTKLQLHTRLKSEPPAEVVVLNCIDRYNTHALNLVRSTQNRMLDQSRREMSKWSNATPVANKTLPSIKTTPNNN